MRPLRFRGTRGHSGSRRLASVNLYFIDLGSR